MSRKIIIGSRGSDLALWQANFVREELEKLGHQVEIKVIKTQGDKIQHLSFDKIEGKGFFTKEIEAELMAGSIDLAVHSHKDLETACHPQLEVAGVSDREDPADILVINPDSVDVSKNLDLKEGAKVGTSSARRKCQLTFFREDIELVDIRGNVPTRLDKLRTARIKTSGNEASVREDNIESAVAHFDAIMLASAGVKRLDIDLSDFHVVYLKPEEFVPAPAQGVLGYQIRKNEPELREIVQNLNSPEVQECIGVEREVLRLFNGGCQLPLGVYCKKLSNDFHVWASMAHEWDQVPKRAFLTANSAEELAASCVAELKKKDAFASS